MSTEPNRSANPATRAAAHTAPRADLPSVDLALIEERVRETGAFSVVQWLIDNGVLPYGAYERWRYGDLANLEAALDCDATTLAEHLDVLARQARSLGLVDAPETFYHWAPEAADQALTLSPSAERSRRLAQRWQRPAATSQLDLFMDTGATSAEQALRHALAAHHRDTAEQSHAHLCHLAPNHASLGAYEALVLYSRHIADHPMPAMSEVADELDGLDAEIAPLARDVMGDRATDYLAPAWRRLAQALAAWPFDPDHPRLHASYAWLRTPEPAAVRASVEAEPDHAAQPVLLMRLAATLAQQRLPVDAMLVWARCYETDPATARRAAEEVRGQRWLAWLRAFDDLDPSLDAGLFPAWLLLRVPALADRLGEAPDRAVPQGSTFWTVERLLRARARGETEVGPRQRLQSAAPELLASYLQGD